MKPTPSTNKEKIIKAWAVTVDGEICWLMGSMLRIHSSKVLPNKYQKVVRCEIKLIKSS